MKVMKANAILADLGIEPNERVDRNSILKQYRRLAPEYGGGSIWMRRDYGVVVGGDIVAHTKDLIVVR